MNDTDTWDLSQFVLFPVEKCSSSSIPTKDWTMYKLEIMDILKNNKPALIYILSCAAYFRKQLGGQNEYRNIVAHHIDKIMEQFGFKCVEVHGYDLISPSGKTISTKTGGELFHTETKKVKRSQKVSRVTMNNSHPGKKSKRTKPVFDILLLIQLDPYLVCAITDYAQIVDNIDDPISGCVLKNVSFDVFDYLITPTEMLPPIELTKEEKKSIDVEVEEHIKNPTLFKKLLDKRNISIDTTIPKSEIW